MIRFALAESLLIGCLAALAVYVLFKTVGEPLGLNAIEVNLRCCQGLIQWKLGFIVVGIVPSCAAAVAAHWLLQNLGMTRLAFWSITLLTLVIQAPAIFVHNSINWLPTTSVPWLTTELGASTVAALLLSSLTLLVALHRVADLRSLYAKLEALRIDSGERRAVTARELAVLGGLVGISLIVAVALLAGGSALAELDTVVGRSPWTVLSIGAAALCLLACCLYLWLRRHGSV